MAIYLLATLDTKGQEAELIRQRLVDLDHDVTVVDVGAIGEPRIQADVSRQEVFRAAGVSLESIQEAGDRGAAITAAANGAAVIVEQAFESGQLDGVVALGGSAGTTIGSTAMRSLPIGLPKVMLSTLASGQVRPYVADKDITMMNSVVDLAGINRICRQVLLAAAHAVAGMVAHRQVITTDDRPIVAATMFGVTTPCVQHARQILEDNGYEVLVFHATGNGGQAMESLIREGLIAGVLDITTTELADELVGGILSAGTERLTAAAESAIPQVVSVGATDMVNFGPPESIPASFNGRLFYRHNPTVTLMRTTAAECQELGQQIARKVAASKGPAAILLPLDGVSAIDKNDQPFDDPAARHALFDGIRNNQSHLQLIEMDCHINDERFAEAAAHRLLEMMR